jgi:DNA-binding GntR family transcriptional regulator
MDIVEEDPLTEAPKSNLHRVPKVDHAQNLPAHVQQMLLEAILTRVLVPGERLLIDEIAAHFGISKIPVREAVKALVASGWLESQPRRGTYVPTLSEQELQEVFEMRRVLEPYAARKAAERRTEEHLAELRVLIAEGTESVRRRDILANSRINSRFHSVIAEAVGNRIIAESLKDLQSRIRRYYVEIDWKIRRDSFVEHKHLFEAIRDRDGDLAERLTNEHLDHAESFAERPAK